MTNAVSGKSVVQFRMQPSQLLGMVREAAADSANVKFGNHALDRMDEERNHDAGRAPRSSRWRHQGLIEDGKVKESGNAKSQNDEGKS